MGFNNLIEDKEKISSRIDDILNNCDFELSIKFLVFIHDKLFRDVLLYAGYIRKDNLEKPEDILNGESVHYADYNVIVSLLRFALNSEMCKNYQNMSVDYLIENIGRFVSRIWGIHPFLEGNTRTVCVFLEEYLRSLGYNVNNEIFKENSEYFRNALVRSNYENKELGIEKDYRALDSFLYKVLVDHELELDLSLLDISNGKKRSKKKI